MRVCMLHQKAPPPAGELSVSNSEQTEGEQLVALGSSEPFPFRLLIAFAATFPVNGDSFKACSHAQVKAQRIYRLHNILLLYTSLC